MSWWITKVEVGRDGTRTIYHRNGGPFADAGGRDTDKVTKVWTHLAGDPFLPDGGPCPVCSPRGGRHE